MRKLEGKIKDNGGGAFVVWAEQVDGDSDYQGPQANVYANNDWLYIVTDDYDGCAMINIEALPALIAALSTIQNNICPHNPPDMSEEATMSEWQPIKSVPKDQDVFIYGPDWPSAPVARFTAYPGNPVEDVNGKECNMYGWLLRDGVNSFLMGEEEGWLGWDGDPEPTLWQALPNVSK